MEIEYFHIHNFEDIISIKKWLGTKILFLNGTSRDISPWDRNRKSLFFYAKATLRIRDDLIIYDNIKNFFIENLMFRFHGNVYLKNLFVKFLFIRYLFIKYIEFYITSKVFRHTNSIIFFIIMRFICNLINSIY